MIKMVEVFRKAVNLQTLVLFVLLVHKELTGALAYEKVFFDKYGDYSKSEPFDLREERYQALAKGGGFYHEAQDCSISFKAASGYGICMSFDDFFIDDCSMKLLIYESKDNKGDIWKELTCVSERPSQMCTSERYVTLRVRKDMLIRNKGYDFEINIEQSSSVTDEGVVFASIGFVVIIIVGVVGLLILIALVVYCCCRNKGDASSTNTSSTKHSMSTEQVQPSAPPLLDGEERADPAIHLYPHLQLQQETPMLDPPPPPYELPPPYSPQHS